MAMREMQKAIATLRLLLADIMHKEEELHNLRRQFQLQLKRAPNAAIQGNPLEATLSAMDEIQERLDGIESTRNHLASIKARAEAELEALELTDRVEQAKTQLAFLKTRESSGEVNDEERQETRELERFIQEASTRAGEAITGGPGWPES